jgi:hypothetical protein
VPVLFISFLFYESRKRELKTRLRTLIYEDRYDERLKN